MASSVIRVSWDASRDLKGLAGGSDGRMAYIHNIGPGTGTIKDEAASSTAGNRFALNGDYSLPADCSVILMYDSTSSRWRLFGQQTASGSTLPVADTQTIIKGSADATKLIRFEADGLTTGTTRVLTPQDADYTIENTVHASKHVSGGSDSIKLDDLAAPDDNTDLDASITAHGLLKKLSNSSTEFMNGVGNWATPASTLDINGLTAAYLDSASDAVPYYSAVATANRKFAITRLAAQTPTPIMGRLSTESGVYVSTTDQVNKSTIYWEGGHLLPCQDSNGWLFMAAPSSRSLSGMTAGKQYDVFFFNGAMDLAPAWTSDTTRSTGITLSHGVIVNTSTFTSVITSTSFTAGYALYLGTIRANDSTTIDDSEANRHLWNAYNRVRKPVRKFETTDGPWTWSTASYQQMNASSANQISVVCGLGGASCIDLALHHFMDSSTIQVGYCAIGEDGTTGPATGSVPCPMPVSVATFYAIGKAHLVKFPAIGRRYYTALERGAGSGTQRFFGDAGAPTKFQSGLLGVWDC